jgi:hypothetical protein
MTIQDNPTGLWWLLGTVTVISFVLQSEAWLEAHVQQLLRWALAL